jgi:hypothetical protein
MVDPRRHLLSLAAAISAGLVTGQCVSTFDLGPDTSLCAGQPLTISATPGYQSYLWSTGSTTNGITVAAAGTYSCTVTEIATSGSVIINGDFSAGATGFTSDYVPGTGGPWGPVSLAGTYAASTSPFLVHTNFASFGDHTTGTGSMLVVNGADIAGQDIWCQTVAVLPNTTYAFSAWLASATPSSPAQLSFTVDGVSIGNLNAVSTTGLWLNFYSLWNSGAATSVTLCITNLNTQQSGNDFAIDDILFSPFCTYTDDVVVTYFNYPEPDLGPDTTYCADVTITLDPQWPSADAITWQDGSSTSPYIPSTPGIYWVDVMENGCTTRDSVLVTELPLPVADIGADQQQCEGDVVFLDAAFPGATYSWQNGSTAPTFTVDQSGTYSVTLDLAGCLDRDTVTYTYFSLPIVDLGNDTSICEADDLFLDVARPGGSYQWENGYTFPQRQTTGAGVYWVIVEENNCTTTDSLVLEKIALPVAELGPDRLLCAGSTEELVVEGPGYTYLWSDGSTGSSVIIDGPDIYSVTVTNVCGTDVDSVVIALDYCDCPVYVPNSFTANGDGINDGFLPQFTCPNRSYTLRIFDRWGAVQWETTDPFLPWEGGELATGVYAWTVEYEPDSDVLTGKRAARGHVVLLR